MQKLRPAEIQAASATGGSHPGHTRLRRQEQSHVRAQRRQSEPERAGQAAVQGWSHAQASSTRYFSQVMQPQYTGSSREVRREKPGSLQPVPLLNHRHYVTPQAPLGCFKEKVCFRQVRKMLFYLQTTRITVAKIILAFLAYLLFQVEHSNSVSHRADN